MKNMKKLFLVLMFCGAFLLMGNTASAVPVLQLDIVGGTYDGDTTIIDGTSGSFQLVALLNPFNGNYDSSITNYYISAAVVPKQDYSGLESPSFDSVSLGAGTYGDPGLEHGYFDTYYWEKQFDFTAATKVNSYDVAGPGDLDPVANSLADPYLWAVYFNVDVSSLLADPDIDAVHFDLYAKEDGFASKNIKAPFSHDASAVPEPATMLLLGSGLVGLAGIGRKKFKK